jgi:hypothetical protein
MLFSGTRTVLTELPAYMSPALRSSRGALAIAAGTVVLGGAAWYFLRRPRPSPEDLERERREQLGSSGRITDGSILETAEGHITHAADIEESHGTPQVIIYNYRIAGVIYEAAQDVTTLSDMVRDIRTDLPVQVRYEPHNPANSIVVAENWSGLRLSADVPRPILGIDRHAEAEEHA